MVEVQKRSQSIRERSTRNNGDSRYFWRDLSYIHVITAIGTNDERGLSISFESNYLICRCKSGIISSGFFFLSSFFFFLASTNLKAMS